MKDGPAPPADRRVWTDEDFDELSWHDSAVHAFAFEPGAPGRVLVVDIDTAMQDLESEPTPSTPETRKVGRLLLDLDYIVDYVDPTSAERWFSFWMSPGTLAFENVYNLEGDFGRYETLEGYLALDNIRRSEPDDDGEREWTLDGFNFALTFRSRGFRLYLRRAPILVPRTRLEVDERGGLSFAEL
jgi:hypothetical protein